MYKICVISVYFGPLPNSFQPWLLSCKANKTIDYLLVTDQQVDIGKAKNIRIIKLEFSEFVKKVNSTIGFETALSTPYKCCDFRPIYGEVFKEYLKKYDFWGHCDMDMVFGDIRYFITDEMLEKYDKILPLGHLSLYRNTEEVNQRYKLKGGLWDYKEVYQKARNVGFDEMGGIYKIYQHNNFPMYDERIFADISKVYRRFKLCDYIGGTLKTVHKDYIHQVFYYEDGKVFRTYKDENDEINREEYIYIHFQKRQILCDNFDDEKDNKFYITNNGFIKKTGQIISVEDIKKYNPYYGKWIERIESINYRVQRSLSFRIQRYRDNKK